MSAVGGCSVIVTRKVHSLCKEGFIGAPVTYFVAEFLVIVVFVDVGWGNCEVLQFVLVFAQVQMEDIAPQRTVA